MISNSKLAHKYTLTRSGWSTERKHDLCMDVRHVNILIDGQLKNTGRSLLVAEGCQLWGMRGHVLLGKWSGVWLCLVGRKSLLMLRRRPWLSNLRHARPHTHTHTHTHTRSHPNSAALLSLWFITVEENRCALTRKVLIGNRDLQLWRC